MPGVEVIVPWADTGCFHRARALRWLLARYRAEHPGWKVTVAAAPSAPWVKALAVNPAVRASRADVVIVADADVWTGLDAAVAAVREGAAWAVPHTTVHRLTEHATDHLVNDLPWQVATTERPYRGVAGGGVVVAPRITLAAIPLDPRFEGWGQEDLAWAVALRALAGREWRGPDDLVHLFHPPQSRRDRRVGSHEGRDLYRRYVAAAREGTVRVRELIEEVPPCPSTT